MAGKIKVTPEMILDASIEIVRKDGIEAVNARRIGKELNCSLQPVYYYFETMDNLREKLYDKAMEYIRNYININSDKTRRFRFKDGGLLYIRFAKEEKNLFKFLFMSNKKESYNPSLDPNNTFRHILNISTFNWPDLTEENKTIVLNEVWIATHGIATMIATDYMEFTDEQISSLLNDFFNGSYNKYKNK